MTGSSLPWNFTWLLVLSAFLLISRTPSCDGAAQTIKIPLIRAVTYGAGPRGQPAFSYYAPLNIGNPPKPFNVQFDVGLSEIFVPHYSWNVFNTNLHYSKGFRCQDSSTCIKHNKEMTTSYQQTQLTGKLYEDAFNFISALSSNRDNITSSHSTPLTLRQNFLAISSASAGTFKDLPVDGFIGLNFRPESPNGVKSLLAGMYQAQLIELLQFSLWLNPTIDSPRGGELTLGGVDQNRFTGIINWHKQNPMSTHWSLMLNYVKLGHQVVGCNGVACQAMFSSTVDDIVGPSNEVNAIYSLLGSTNKSPGIQVIECARVSDLPALYFNIDGIEYSVLPTMYVRKLDYKQGGRCYLAIQPSQVDRNEWTLGTSFLGSYYSIFDITNQRIGFATLR